MIKSHISEKSMKKVKGVLKKKIYELQKNPSIEKAMKYNSAVMGIQNYYKIATHVYLDLKQISYELSETIKKRMSRIGSKRGKLNKTYLKYYGKYKRRVIYIEGHPLFPISGINTHKPFNFTQEINLYTEKGRVFIHNNLKIVSPKILRYLMNNPIIGQSSEYNDNRMSLYVGQNGLCAITKRPLEIGDMVTHHKKMRQHGGKDDYNNLIFVIENIHKLIHAKSDDTIQRLLTILNLGNQEIEKVNKLRKLIENDNIVII